MPITLFLIPILLGFCLSEAVAVGTNDSVWQHWKQKYARMYNGPDEQERRLIWERNVAEIQEHNLKYDLGLVSYRKGVNQFTDMTWDEFKRVYLSTMPTGPKRNVMEYRVHDNSRVSDSIDWREKGAVRPVKDQGNCGSFWAFSTTGSLEGQYAIHQNKSVSLSEQQLMDCSTTYGNRGCFGGLMEFAYEYVHDFWIEREEGYPYVGLNKECLHTEADAILTVTGYYSIRSGEEDVLKHMIAKHGPVSVAIDADEGFRHYAGGVFTSSACSSFAVNHGILAVGYGSEPGGKDYWIVKNSWGETWGQNGYMKMARTGKNMCGIASAASLPLIVPYKHVQQKKDN